MSTANEKIILWTVLDFGESSYSAGTEYLRDNRQELPEGVVLLHCALNGEIVLHNSSGDQLVCSGNLMICQHGDGSSYGSATLTQDYSCLWVRLVGDGLPGHFGVLRDRYGSVLNLGVHHSIIPGIRRLCALTDPKDPADPLVMAAAVHRLVMSLFAYAEIGFHGKLTPVNQAIHCLVSAPFHAWNIKELAASCGCSREHLCREFSAQYGQSPQQFLVQYRGQRALYLLQHTALSISSIAAQTGFPSIASLDRQIRSMVGRTPQELRPMLHADKPPGGKLQGLYDENRLL